ncbi:MAG: prepilin-type N-terminal cleavage/methylation domain-containing protein [Opitutaceae bacterium]|nr:prepilin-type N-terminal cleavage/methylation domain-containing protein [Opitutaceae bacterium]
MMTYVSATALGRAARARCRRSAFTIVEVLIALAIVGLIMIAMNTFVFSMGELWGRGGDVRLFDLHVRNVSRFLERELQSASFPPNVAAGTGAVSVKEIKSASGLESPLLTFELREGGRLMVWPEQPLPEVICSLAVRDGEGLLLLWHSRLEKRFAEDAPRETSISPWVAAMAYDYFDPDSKDWKTERTLRRTGGLQEGYDTPQRIRLTFRHGKLTEESIVSLPQVGEGLPMF